MTLHARALLAAALLLMVPGIAIGKTIKVPRCVATTADSCYEDSTFLFQVNYEVSYNTVDSALALAEPGDRIYIQSGSYTAPEGGFKITKSLEIFGDGMGQPTFAGAKATILRPNPGGEDPVLVVDVTSTPPGGTLWNINIHDLQVAHDPPGGVPASEDANANGIECKIPGNNKVVGNLLIERVFVYGMGNDGIHIDGQYTVGAIIKDCYSAYNSHHGLFVSGATVLRIQGSYFTGNWWKGAYFNDVSTPSIIGCAFERNERGAYAGRVSADDYVPSQLFLENANGFHVTGCHFESFRDNDGSGVKLALAVNSLGGSIGECIFVDDSQLEGDDETGILVGFTSHAINIGVNSWNYVARLVEIHDVATVTSCFVMPQSVRYTTATGSKMLIPEAANRGHIVMPQTTNGIGGLTAGIEFPRLSNPARNAMATYANGGTKRKGLVIYADSTSRLQHWDGSRWLEGIASVAGSEQTFLNQSATISSTPILASPPSGLYRITVWFLKRASGSGSRTLNLSWTDEWGAQTKTWTIASNDNAGKVLSEVYPLSIASGSLSFSCTASGNPSWAYGLRLRVEALP